MKLLFLLLPFLGAALPAFADDPAEELAREMQKTQANVQQVLEQVRQRTGGNLGVSGLSQLEQAREKVLRLAADDRFLKAAQELWAHPKRSLVLWVNLGVFILMIFVKAWRQSKARNWFTRLVVGFFLTVFTWALMLGAVPALLLGEPFHIFVGTLAKTIFQ